MLCHRHNTCQLPLSLNSHCGRRGRGLTFQCVDWWALLLMKLSTGRTPPWGRLPACLWPLETCLSRCNKAEAAATRAARTWERSFQLISSTRRRRALSVLPLKAIKMKATQSQTLLMRTFICYVGTMLNCSSCLSFLFLVVSHHKNLSAPSHQGEPQLTGCQGVAPVHQRKFSFRWFLMYAVVLYVTVLFVSLNRRGHFAGKFSSVQHVQQELLNRTGLTHPNQGLHICGTEIISYTVYLWKEWYRLMEKQACN